MLGMFYPESNFNADIKENFTRVGNNTGNNVFWTSLKKLLPIERIPYEYERLGISLESYDAIITTDLIWIRQGDNFEFLEYLLKKTSKPIIPISIGLQANDYDLKFQLTERTVRLIKRLEERAVLGVRGEFTAAVLRKYDIKNISVIGCPSMYYWNNPELRITNNVRYPNNFLCNFKTFYGTLNRKEKHFLAYAANYNTIFIEQTIHQFEPKHANDEAYYVYVKKWLKDKSYIYFDIERWMQETCLYDFSMGARFHGNVVSLWNNIKSLFLITDSRTKELTSHFMLPTLAMEDFDKDRDIQYYYELADYTYFNQGYAKRFREFTDFLKSNGIAISENVPVKKYASNNDEKIMYEKQSLLGVKS